MAVYEINQVFLIGRLARDPELKYTNNGRAFCRFAIANNPTTKEENVFFFDVVAWDKQAENISKYMSKGKQIGLVGRLQQNRWEDQSGQKRSRVEIIANSIQFLSSGPGASRDTTSSDSYEPPVDSYEPPDLPSDNQYGSQTSSQSGNTAQENKSSGSELSDIDVDDIADDDDIPF
jgi:single-strand DNA-binding protein